VSHKKIKTYLLLFWVSDSCVAYPENEMDDHVMMFAKDNKICILCAKKIFS